MQRVLGHMRKAIEEFDMIKDGDRIGVGVSGGKDSLALLYGLVKMKSFIGIDYDVVAITLDPNFGRKESDYSSVQKLCDDLHIEYALERTHIGEIVFDVRKESNPCSLCARMRRGALHNIAKAHNCNKLALGHNYNDVVETFVMNLFNEGRIGCFSPVTYLDRKDITVIRPLVFASEREIRKACDKTGLQIVKSRCPVDGCTSRQKTKEFLRTMEHENKGFSKRLFGAMRRGDIDGWGYNHSKYYQSEKDSKSIDMDTDI